MLATEALAQNAAAEEDCIQSGSNFTVDSDKSCLKASDLIGQLELSTPNNALFTLLNVTPDNVIKPEPGEPLSISLLPQAIDALQNEAFAVSIEFNPGLFLFPDEYSMQDLIGRQEKEQRTKVEKQIRRAKLLLMLSFSAIASNTTGDEKKSVFGAGVNFTYDQSSPLNSKTQSKFGDCVSNKFDPKENAWAHELMLDKAKEIMRQTGASPQDAQKKAHERLVTENERYKIVTDGYIDATIVENCIAEVAPWNRTLIGAGVSLYDQDATILGVKSSQSGAGVWGSVSISPSQIFSDDKSFDNSLVTISGRLTDDLIRERNDISETVDGWNLGARFTQQFDNDLTGPIRGFVETAHYKEEFGGIEDSFQQVGIGGEFKLSDKLFLQLTIGDTFGSVIDRGQYMSGQLKWSFSGAKAK